MPPLVGLWLGGAIAQEPPGADYFLDELAIECAQQLGLDEEKCVCVTGDAEAALLPIEIEYAAVRIAENEAEITRLREILPLGQRLRILWTIIAIVEECADGTTYNNPLL